MLQWNFEIHCVSQQVVSEASFVKLPVNIWNTNGKAQN